MMPWRCLECGGDRDTCEAARGRLTSTPAGGVTPRGAVDPERDLIEHRAAGLGLMEHDAERCWIWTRSYRDPATGRVQVQRGVMFHEPEASRAMLDEVVEYVPVTPRGAVDPEPAPRYGGDLMDVCARTRDYEDALSDMLDTDERLAEYADAVADMRAELEAARRATPRGAVDPERDLIERALPLVAYAKGTPAEPTANEWLTEAVAWLDDPGIAGK
jgi:hypothetical protein